MLQRSRMRPWPRWSPDGSDPSGAILQLGALNCGLAQPASPASTTVAAAVGMAVAKSGRTTGLTCGTISEIACDGLKVQYQNTCGSTATFTVTFNNQMVIESSSFGDAGDSGSLIVEAELANRLPCFLAATRVPVPRWPIPSRMCWLPCLILPITCCPRSSAGARTRWRPAPRARAQARHRIPRRPVHIHRKRPWRAPRWSRVTILRRSRPIRQCLASRGGRPRRGGDCRVRRAGQTAPAVSLQPGRSECWCGPSAPSERLKLPTVQRGRAPVCRRIDYAESCPPTSGRERRRRRWPRPPKRGSRAATTQST